MVPNYKTEAVAKLAQEIAKAGFRVFIAKTGTYGFYTDAAGSRVVSFQYDFAGFRYGGNYKSKKSGTGWVLAEASFADMFAELPPHWATKNEVFEEPGERVALTTLAEHLAIYQKSSAYVEYVPEDSPVNGAE